MHVIATAVPAGVGVGVGVAVGEADALGDGEEPPVAEALAEPDAEGAAAAAHPDRPIRLSAPTQRKTPARRRRADGEAGESKRVTG